MVPITYTHHRISKGNGKWRHINAPNLLLKEFQNDILRNSLYKTSPHPANHGFVPGRSIVTNAAQHLQRKFVLSMDIKNFFPSTKKDKVEQILARFFPNQLENLPVFLWRGALPQGAPTSPYLANFALYDFDEKFSIFCEALDATYTRYADDLTVSFDEANVPEILNFVNTELNKESYFLSFKKTHLAPYYKRQKVTGIIVNEKLNIPHEIRNQLRAYNHLVNTNRFDEDLVPWVAGLNGYNQMTKQP